MILEKLRGVVRFATDRASGRKASRSIRPEMRETLGAVSSTLASMPGFGAYNPDDLVTRKGYVIYDQMQTDAQVAACLHVKKFAVLAGGWEVEPLSDSPEDQEAAEFIRFCLNDMRGSILDALYKALDAIAKGFSICEINYKLISEGPYQGRIGLDSIKSKDPSELGFEMDDYLNVKRIVRRWPASETKPMPPDKFVIYTYMPRYESPYGQSDLRPAYRHWWSKDAILRFYNTYLEKYGSPTAKGTYRKGTTKQQQDDLLRVLDKIQQETAIVVPEDVVVELLEAQRGGEAGYVNALEHHDRQIAKAILGQTLAIDEGGSTGSYAQAKVHLEVMQYHVDKLKRDLEESVVGEQIIRRLIEYNYGHRRRPVFRLGTAGG